MTFEEAQEKAVEMQKFCEEYDVLVIVNMEPTHGGVFRGRLIEVAARKNGLVFGEMNIFHRANRRTRGARQLFSMASLFKPGEFDPSRFDEFTTGGLTFFMTIPVTYDPPGAFDEMLECVHGMCESLDGRLIDRDREPLTDDALARIRVQLQRITADMENRGVPPGGETAMRLF
jgi:cell division protein ZipA